jgi:pantoate--beta-alanine ligase
MTAVLETIPAARQWVREQRSAGLTLGLVPTMGALHEGHLSLIRRARQRCDRTLLSIFVNPLQFGPGEDYERYPRDFERDRALAEREGIDGVFHPDAKEMYPEPLLVTVSPGKLSEPLCGVLRPGHFEGVATVVAKLFQILQPDRAFFGQKDAQQAVIVQRLVEDLNLPVEIEICPTVREPDGLAMSSRNRYLSAQERSQAAVLYRSLKKAEALVRAGVRDAARVEQEMREMIQAVPAAELDYARVVDRRNLGPVRTIDGEVLAAVAVRFGKTRLIDNRILSPKKAAGV